MSKGNITDEKTTYDKLTPETKRRIALKLLGCRQVKSTDPRRELWKDDNGNLYELFFFRVEESLDQCALLIEKAKENSDTWINFDRAVHKYSFIKNPYRSLGCYNANAASLKADELLFCLFVAFGIDLEAELRKQEESK